MGKSRLKVTTKGSGKNHSETISSVEILSRERIVAGLKFVRGQFLQDLARMDRRKIRQFARRGRTALLLREETFANRIPA